MKFWEFVTRGDPRPWPEDNPADTRRQLRHTYRVPYPPEAGRRVQLQTDGTVWVIDPTGDVAREDDRSIIYTWGQLLAMVPVELIDLTPEESASEPLYGPVGARWGIPGTPCAYEGCALSMGHASVHQDDAGNVLGMTPEATELYVDPPRGTMLSRICTCKHPMQHLPGCDRYVTPTNPPATAPLPADIDTAVAQLADAVHEPPATPAKPTVPGRRRGKTTPPAASPRKRAPRKANPS